MYKSWRFCVKNIVLFQLMDANSWPKCKWSSVIVWNIEAKSNLMKGRKRISRDKWSDINLIDNWMLVVTSATMSIEFDLDIKNKMKSKEWIWSFYTQFFWKISSFDLSRIQWNYDYVKVRKMLNKTIDFHEEKEENYVKFVCVRVRVCSKWPSHSINVNQFVG